MSGQDCLIHVFYILLVTVHNDAVCQCHTQVNVYTFSILLNMCLSVLTTNYMCLCHLIDMMVCVRYRSLCLQQVDNKYIYWWNVFLCQLCQFHLTSRFKRKTNDWWITRWFVSSCNIINAHDYANKINSKFLQIFLNIIMFNQ